MQLKTMEQRVQPSTVQAPISAGPTEQICSFHPALVCGQRQGGMWAGKGE